MDAYVATLNPGELEQLRRALLRRHGARSMVCPAGANSPPSTGVLTESCVALNEIWTRIGMDLALAGWVGAAAAACSADERALVDALLAATMKLERRVTATTTTTTEDPRDKWGLLSTGLINMVARQRGAEGQHDRGSLPMTVQVLSVGDPVEHVEGPWRQTVTVTDGETQLRANAFTQLHHLLEGGTGAIVTLLGYTMHRVPGAANNEFTLVIDDLVVVSRVGDPNHPGGLVGSFPSPSLGVGPPPTPPSYRCDAAGGPPGGPSYVAPFECDGCFCGTVNASETGTHRSNAPGPGCILTRVPLPTWRSAMRGYNGAAVADPCNKNKRHFLYGHYARNVYCVGGVGNRALLPKCVVGAIRTAHPAGRAPSDMNGYTDNRTDGSMEWALEGEP